MSEEIEFSMKKMETTWSNQMKILKLQTVISEVNIYWMGK